VLKERDQAELHEFLHVELLQEVECWVERQKGGAHGQRHEDATAVGADE